MKKEKHVYLSFLDGRRKGRIKCSFENWTGLLYKIPRKLLYRIQDLRLLNHRGIYFLFGQSEEKGEALVYIGQTGMQEKEDGVMECLFREDKNPESIPWTEVIALTTFDNSLKRRDISFLKKKFCKLALEGKKYSLTHDKKQIVGILSKEERERLWEIIEDIKISMELFSNPLIEVEDMEEEVEQERELYTLRREDVLAKGICTEEGFMVLPGSKMRLLEYPTCPKSVLKERRKFLKYKENVSKDGILLVEKHFKSPSDAANFLLGVRVNGWKEWKNEEGISLRSVNRMQKSQKGRKEK